MKLITHNMLTSKCVKGVAVGYPLAITSTDTQLVKVEYNPEFVARVLPKIDWDVLRAAAEQLGHGADLPPCVADNFEADDAFLRRAHHALLEIEVLEGTLACPETGRPFPITRGIPNMLLTEAEV